VTGRRSPGTAAARRPPRRNPRAWRRTLGQCAGFAAIVLQALGAGAAHAQAAIPVKREILALYDSAQEGVANATRIHRFAEMPLNHLGYILRFQDVRAKLPEAAEIARYRGVLTWFAGPVADGDGYLDWADRVLQANLRYVILGDVGAPINPDTLPAVNRLLGPAGVRHTGDIVGPTLGTRVTLADSGLVQFECRLGPVLPDYPILEAANALERVGVMLETPPDDGARTSVLVSIGERGAYAAWNYEMCHQRPPLYQGQWLINPFDFFRAAFGADDSPIPDTTTASGNRIYFNVLGSDGLTRPSRIEAFGDGSATAGEVDFHQLIEPYRSLPATLELHGQELANSEKSGSQTQLLLKQVLKEPGVDLLGRPLQVTLSRFDSEYPSVSNLAPLFSAEPEHFINKPMSDDAAYASQSEPGESGFAALLQTVAGTDSPRRLKPFNLNEHAYAGEYPALLRSVQTILSAASAAPVTPVSANRYAAIVVGFQNARIERIGAAAWRISDRGALQTVRFDAAEGRVVDYRASVGVIGSKQVGSTLYVALDERVDPAIVALAAQSSAASAGGLALVDSRWMIHTVVREGCGLRFEAHGYGDGSFSWSGASGRYTISVDRKGQDLWRGEAESDPAGQLRFTLPLSAIEPVNVRIGCIVDSASRGN